MTNAKIQMEYRICPGSFWPLCCSNLKRDTDRCSTKGLSLLRLRSNNTVTSMLLTTAVSRTTFCVKIQLRGNGSCTVELVKRTHVLKAVEMAQPSRLASKCGYKWTCSVQEQISGTNFLYIWLFKNKRQKKNFASVQKLPSVQEFFSNSKCKKNQADTADGLEINKSEKLAWSALI